MKKLTLFLPFLLFSCVQTTYLGNSQKTYPINFDDVQVFEEEKDVPIEFEKVALLSLENADRFKYEEAKEKASDIGCNGVIMRNFTKTTYLEKRFLGKNDQAEFIAIRFKVNGEYPPKRTKFKVRGDDVY